MNKLRISMLGTFSVQINQQIIADFQTQATRALLAYLSIESDRPHEREYLAALFWPDMPIEQSLTNLRKTLHRLRQAFGEDNELFIISRQTIQLPADHIEYLDLALFTAYLEQIQGHRHRQTWSCRECVEKLEKAFLLASGDLLAGFSLDNSRPFDQWLHIHREALQDQLLFILEELIIHGFAKKQYQRTIELTKRCLALDAFNELANHYLIESLWRIGRRSAALHQYEKHRKSLYEELHSSPLGKTTALYEEIRQTQHTTQAAKPFIVEPAGISTHFVGRSDELQWIEDRINDPACRLLTIIGPGGIGKTHLALQALKALEYGFPGGSLIVPLIEINQSHQIFDQLAQILETPTGPSTEEAVLYQLQQRQPILILIDNCEHLPGIDQPIARILKQIPHATIIATSRSALNLINEQILALDGLTLPILDRCIPAPEEYAAGQLFLQISADRANQQITNDQHALIYSICQLVDGTPLAITLAAQQLHGYTLTNLQQKLQKDLNLLASHAHDLPPRHRSLKAVFDNSWNLLNDHQRLLLMQISIFQGRFSDHAVNMIFDPQNSTLPELVRQSLVQFHGDSYYSLHEMIRQFANENYHTYINKDTIQANRQRYAAYYLGLAAEWEPEIDGNQAILRRVTMNRKNLLQAWEWAIQYYSYPLIQQSARVITHIYEHTNINEGIKVFQQSLYTLHSAEIADVTTKRSLLAIYRSLTALLHFASRGSEAIEIAHHMISLAKEVGDRLAEAEGALRLGEIAMHQFDTNQAWWYLQQADQYASEAQRIKPIRQAALIQAHSKYACACLLDRTHQPIDFSYIEAACQIYRSLGANAYLSLALNRFANQHRRNGNIGRSLEYRQDAAAMIQKLNLPDIACRILNDLGDIYLQIGCYEEAHQAYEQSLAYAREVGRYAIQFCALEGLAHTTAHFGDLEMARTYMFQAIEIDQQYTTNSHRGYLLHTLGWIYEQEKNYRLAEENYQESLICWQKLGLEGYAWAEAAAGLLRIALEQQKINKIVYYVQQLSPLYPLNTETLADILHIPLVYWSLWRGLIQTNPQQANQLLEQIYQLLTEQMHQLHPVYQTWFAQAPLHKLLLHAHEQHVVLEHSAHISSYQRHRY